VNAVSYFLSAVLIARLRHGQEHDPHAEAPRLREGIAALRPRPMLAAAVATVGVAVTFSAGTWIGGMPTFIRDTLHRGAGTFSIVMVGYAIGSILSGLVLTRVAIENKARASILAWCTYLPAYALIAFAHSLPVVLLGAFCAAVGQSSAIVLVNSAAQEEVPDSVLGRVIGVISLTHRGAHATGLLFVAPLFAVVAAPAVFAVSAVAIPLAALTALAVATRAPASRRTLRF
jgi:hypothetical protein